MWSGQFVKGWSKTMAVLALRSGESELAAVVRAATEGMGLQSILNDFCLCGHVAIKSDATAHLAVGDLWVQHRSGKIRVAKNVRTRESERCTNQVSRTRTTVASHENVQLGSCC